MKNQYLKVVPFFLFTLALILLFFLVRPVITILLGSVLFAYVTYPLYKRIKERIPNKTTSIILSLFLVFLIVLIPFVFLSISVIQQGYYFSHSLSSTLDEGALFGFSCNSEGSKVCAIINQAEQFSIKQLSTFGLDTQLHALVHTIEQKITSLILKIPVIVAKMFITGVIAYFILKDWKKLLKKSINFFPMDEKTSYKRRNTRLNRNSSSCSNYSAFSVKSNTLVDK